MRESQPTLSDVQASEPTSIRWVIFGLACAISFMLYVHRYSWNLISPPLEAELNLNKTQMGLLFSLFYYTYAGGQIPSGVIIDRFGSHRFLTGIIAAWSIALVAIAHTTHLALLGAARLLFGATQAGCYPALTKLTRDWFPAEQRTMLQGWIATTAGRAGGAVSPILLGTLLMGNWGLSWQTAVTLLGLLGVGLCLPVWFWMRNTPEDDPRVNEAERRLIRPEVIANAEGEQQAYLPVQQALKNNSLRWFTAQQFLDAGSDVAFVGLIGTYFLEAHGLDIKQTGWLASLPLLGGALGGVAGGWLNDRLIRETGNRRWARSGVGFVGKIIGCGLLVLMLFQESGLHAALCLMLAKFFSDWSQPTTWGTCTDLGGRFAATVFSIINTAGTLGGVAMPLVFGIILDWFTTVTLVDGFERKLTNWTPLFSLLATMYCCSGICWLLVDCTETIQEKGSGGAI